MSFTSAIHDPLCINLHRQTRILQNILPTPSLHATELLNLPTSELLAALSRLLAAPEFTLTIATLYRPILFDLCARWLDDETNTEDQLVALCLLLEIHEELFPILHRLLSKPPFVDGPLGFINTPLLPLSVDVFRLQRLLLSHYRIIHANRELPRLLFWSLTPLSILMWTSRLDNGVRLLAIRCYAIQSGMGEAEREKIEREVLGEPCGVDCLLDYGKNIDGTRNEVDGWIMPVIELQRIKHMREEIQNQVQDYYGTDEGESLYRIDPTEISNHLVIVHGVFLLPVPGPTRDPSSPLISTPTSIQALQSLAFHLSLRLPTLLTSPPSSGKSLFLAHLAEILHPGTASQIITIHLADTSLDPRALLGSYVSSPTQPGTFEWKEGVLVRSMREGKWVVFEDIDKGSNEVLGVIKPLTESLRLGKWIGGRAYLNVPSRGRVIAHDSFAMFATRSVLPSRNGSSPPPVFFGGHKFYEIIVPSPSSEELKTIFNSRFPRLPGRPALAIIRLWEAVKAVGPAASTRDVGLRELEKFFSRVQRLLPDSHPPMDVDFDNQADAHSLSIIFSNPSLREDMYLEARDVFFGAGALTTAARSHMEAIADVIGEHLGLEPERRNWVLRGRTPDFDLEKDVNGGIFAVRIGRSRLPAKITKTEIIQPVMRPFAMHKPAIFLLSRIATAVSLSEPVLLTGETGTGKTSVVTHLASLLRRPLISLNLSHQTESSDLLGGFKPVDARIPGSALQQRFLDLFGGTFSRRKNEKFETEVRKAVAEGKWKRAVGLWKESSRLAKERIQLKKNEESRAEAVGNSEGSTPRKRRKLDALELKTPALSWDIFFRDVEEFEVQHVHGKGRFAFGFVEGPLVKALRSGDWVLLDEINLASPETLECISGLLHGPTASITLTEQGSLEPVPRHPDFRLFACMNPATDVGKKDLPPNIRSRFTEIDVSPPDADKETLLSIVGQYIGAQAVGDKGAIMNVAEFYTAVKDLAERRQLADGSNHRPHYSMRTLARALTFACDVATMFGLRRAIWEGCLMAFTMVLDASSAKLVTSFAQKHLLAGVRNPKSMLTKEPSVPHSRSPDEYVKFGPFYLEIGPLPQDPVENYILTPSVETKLIDLARIIVTRRFPVLIEGPTSSGKTSSVEYLAKRTGHRFIRINNHEHTDIQEYIGSYVSDPLTGRLVFKDGLLVRALRNGDWIVLDELNLAPTDVLEALNRLLDDNRELLIPETQEIIRPHPHFMLFATQNPPGLYAGRKVLSRAFRNRFLEVQFEDVPQGELETILCQRCRIAPSYGKRIVSVFHELQKRRQSSRVFESKQGFATLRDLFRWAGRDAISYQELADNGYMLLAERARREDDKVVVKEVIESIMKVKIDEKAMYTLDDSHVDVAAFLGCSLPKTSGVIWTSAMQRLFTLVSRALRFNEPVLLVGETGSGKTSVCQLFAEACSQRLHGLNCHQNTETADLIGGLRPIRNRSAMEAEVLQEAIAVLQEIGINDPPHTLDALASALNIALKPDANLAAHYQSRVQAIQNKLSRLQSIFEWHDGPLVEAMRNGDVFLLDEISLADDSVLERLNSVLEPSRTIVLAERGGDDLEHSVIRAAESFKLVATMNPGGDYGKKELSPALRNRFTEIWVPRIEDRSDLELIVGSLWKHESLRAFTPCVLDFVEWLCIRVGDRSLFSLRDILAWVTFTNSAYEPENENAIPPTEIFHHAAHMTFLDGLGSLPQLSGFSRDALQTLKTEAMKKLLEIVPPADSGILFSSVPAHNPATSVQFGSFAILKGAADIALHSFNLQAPTTRDNAMRVIRACQVQKPILLEGSPGVGKTSLIAALANISGHKLSRINLSDQTDLIDLFGSDLPVEGGGPGEFAWKDAEFLKALQEGHWVLLDEMNLAPQAVLEGLNAVLDHRGTVYIPELGRSFARHPSFRIFAAQNPLNQGGGRKGLPKSFVNRFTKVYVEELSPNDLLMVCQHMFPDFDETIVRAMISFNMYLNEEVGIQRKFAREGGPWEFNLRDVIRWGSLLRTTHQPLHPIEHLRTVYLQRFRTIQDRNQARLIFDKVFSMTTTMAERAPNISISPSYIQIGHFVSQRKNLVTFSPPGRILKMHLSSLESLGHCISQSWLAILTGPRNSGKTDAVRVLAHFTGNFLQEIPVNSSTDTMDILGSFEQADPRGRALSVIDDILSLLDDYLRSSTGSRTGQDQAQALRKARHGPTPLHTVLRMASDIVSELNDIPQFRPTISSKINALLSTENSAGRFEWIDGPLIQAMKNGHWLLMDGANLCNPSVLDRLNSLCEPNGFLTLSERGYVDGEVQILRPHPNFRLFMTVDPQYGELSRAMRNRGVEIGLSVVPVSDDVNILSDFQRLPSLPGMDPKPQSLAFDAARRGLIKVSLQAPPLMSTSGRILDQDSRLSSLLDQAPIVVLPAISFNNTTDAHLSFLSRTMSPAYIPHFSRFLKTLPPTQSSTHISSFLAYFPGHSLATAFSHLRGAHATFCDLPLDHIFSQPMDFYLTCPPPPNAKLVTNIPSTRHFILHLLDLAVALLLDHQDQSHYMDSETINQKPTNKGSKEIASIIQAISSMGITILGSVKLDDWVLEVAKTKLASSLLGYGRYLRKASMKSSFDFSAVQAISKWIIDAVDNCPPPFLPLVTQAQALVDAVSLTSGFGLVDIWSTFFVEGLSALSSTELDTIDKLASSLKSTSMTIHRRQAFDFMSLRALSGDLLVQVTPTLTQLYSNLHHCLIERCAENIQENADIHYTILISELNAFGIFDNTWFDTIREIIEVAYETRDPLLRMVPYQHLIWTRQAERNEIPVIIQTKIQWLNALWNVSSTNQQRNGPTMLLQPTQLYTTLVSCDWSRNSLDSVQTYEAEIRKNSRLTLLQCQEERSRLEQLINFLYQSIFSVAICFSASFEENVLEALRILTSTPKAKLELVMRDIVACLEESTNHPFKLAVRRTLLPLSQRLHGGKTRDRTIVDLGLCWVAVGTLIIDLFVPDTPIDPASIKNCTSERWRDERDMLESQLSLHHQLEELTTGNASNDFLEFLDANLNDVSSKLASAPKVPVRKDVARLHMFWSEVLQFQQQVLSPPKIEGLISLLLAGDPRASPREQVTQQSMAGFSQRLDVVYTEYSDLSAPLQFAILHMRTGLRLVASSNPPTPTTSEPPALVASALAAFPSVRCAAALCANVVNPGPSGLGPFRRLLVSISAIAMEKALGVNIEMRIEALDVAYEQALRLWLIDRAKEKEMDTADQSLYRRKNMDHDPIGEAEMEEQEFLALFPSFEDVLESEAVSHTQKQAHSTLVQPPDAHHLLTLHNAILGNSERTNVIVRFYDMRKDALWSLLESHLPTLPDTLDLESLPFQLSSLREKLSDLQLAPGHGSVSYNFYVDGNIVEARKAIAVLNSIKTRLEALIGEWPDQMVLHHLRDRCSIILGLGLHSPIAKILSALEQLLLQTEDWEIYSNRQNTLRPHQQELIKLIVEWRRMELSCWQVLLESQAREFKEGVSEWWFRLYDATIRGTLDACERDEERQSDNMDEYLNTLIPLLEDFIRTSPLGQFHARIKLLHTFNDYIHHLGQVKPLYKRLALERVRKVLHATIHYYNLYSEQLSDHLGEQRALLEKEIRGFIKLASWRDINVQALKASAQRTHHQLYKIIRKFRDVLKQPISERLRPQLADNTEAKSLQAEKVPITAAVFKSIPDGNPGTTQPTHLISLNKTFVRFDKFITTKIRPFIHLKDARIADDLAVEIISSAKELSTLTVPNEVPANKREKHQKTILVRKRKAWSDLLKELKRAGFASNVKPEVLQRQANPRWLLEQPMISELEDPEIPMQKSENYLSRLYGCLPELRMSLSHHHSDLTTRELQRGIMLLESGFALSLDLRSRLANAYTKYIKMEQLTRRLKMFISAPKLTLASSDFTLRTSTIRSTLCRLSNALEEVQSGIRTFNDLGPKTIVPESFVQEIQKLQDSTNVLQKRVDEVLRNVKLTSIPILLDTENDLLVEATRHLSQASATLLLWSDEQAQLRYLIRPVEQWLSTQLVPNVPSSAAQTAPPPDAIDSLLNSLLITVQALVSKCPESIPGDQDEDVDNYILRDCHIVRDFTHMLNFDVILTALDDVLLHLAWYGDELQPNLQRILPFFNVYMSLVKDQLVAHNEWTKALLKLNYVLCSVIHTLSTQGFCKPPETDNTKTDGDTSETIGGVGLGEGTGSENVSKDIEDESQVEGLQGDDVDGQDPRDDKGDGDAIEMSEDIGGSLEDVPETESQDDAESDQEDDAGPEEKLGNLDASDPSAVDEKLWGDEKGPEGDQPDDTTTKDNSEKQSNNSEVVAKEAKENSNKEKTDGEKESEEEGTLNTEDQPMPEGIEDEEEGGPDASGAPMDDHVQDGNTLDLPDDMNLGGDDLDMGGEEVKDDDMDDEMEVSQEDNMVEDSGPDQTMDDATKNEQAHEEPLPEDIPEMTDGDQEMEAPDQSQEAEANDDEIGDETPKEAIARPDITAGDGATSANEPFNPQGGESASSGQAGSAQGATGETAPDHNISDSEGLPEGSQPQTEAQPTDSQGTGSALGFQKGQLPSPPESNISANPLRSLGTALEEIRQRFDEILSGERHDTSREKIDDAGAPPPQVEYLQPDDADHEMQALGPAGEEQVAKLNDLKLIDGDDHDRETAPMEVDMPFEAETHEQPPRDQPSQIEPSSNAQRDNIEGAILQGTRPSDDRHLPSDPTERKVDATMEDDFEEIVETQLRDWQSHGFPHTEAEHIWRLYESLTHDLAYALCEQLRLILEPTLATRLKGDYRTGKRLNMKKIISYIASDYTKDKIWLRRTRPSQREYQVLIAIDDSRSMAESHSIHLAYETLALVSKALGRLEAGDIAIAKFGETVDILHGFDEGPFTDQSGAKVMGSFHFNQKATNVLSLIDTSLKVLENAREHRSMSSTTAADLWQLEIIISDGMCQDHDHLRTVLRKAEEQRVMIVFIIIDSLHSTPGNSSGSGSLQPGSTQGSILTMDRAEFKNIDGKMELQLQKYLDSFPFEYYVVLRNVEALPEVLAGTLKQFFERISEE
ncbi:midasin nuclear AAA ATPase [Collybia nuda]|uniref:Midasin n=1 Tax=Collybia nuda TaxID=64659 RepID=A0A9P6CFI2_9AGAR|nr:midasin nuclear AAA ATPase [Collybia nuda]